MAERDTRFLGLRRMLEIVLVLVVGVWCYLFGATWVGGGSMEPTLYRGDIVIYRRGCSCAAAGEIALFARDGGGDSVLHRLISRDDGLWRTRGDANRSPDVEPLEPEDIRGVVVAVVPAGRAWAHIRSVMVDVLHSSTNRMTRSDDGEAPRASVPTGTEPHRLQGFRGRAWRFTPSAAT